MLDKRADNIKTVINDYRNANELTFLVKFWVAIIDLERTVPTLPILETTSLESMTDT